MVKYNRSNIKPFKGKLIRLNYRTNKGLLHDLVGEIISATKEHFIFDINKEKEIFLDYNQIIKLENL